MSFAWAVTIALGYLGVIYASSYIVAPTCWLDRNDPRVIRARIIAVLSYSLILLALYPAVMIFSWRPVLKTLLLLAPFIYIKLNFSSGTTLIRPKPLIKHLKTQLLGYAVDFLNVATWRDYIVGPFAEETVFRHVYLSSTIPHRTYLAALIFGLIHGHPLIFKLTYWPAVIGQCLFTTGFGLYAGRIYMNSGSLLCCFVVHMLCNLVGFPDVDDFTNIDRMERFFLAIWFAIAIVISFYW